LGSNFSTTLNYSMNNKNLQFAAVLVLIAAVSRLIPHPWNFTPVTAMALFAGAVIKDKRWAFPLVMLSMLISDLLVNYFLYNSSPSISYFASLPTLGVYAGIGVIFLLGSSLGKKLTLARTGLFAVAGSLSFFLITNFFCWPGNPMYAQNISGLMQSYIMAIPFMGNIAGDVIYSTLLVGVYQYRHLLIPSRA
jgi:hypothetical protein